MKRLITLIIVLILTGCQSLDVYEESIDFKYTNTFELKDDIEYYNFRVKVLPISAKAKDCFTIKHLNWRCKDIMPKIRFNVYNENAKLVKVLGINTNYDLTKSKNIKGVKAQKLEITTPSKINFDDVKVEIILKGVKR